MSGPHAFSSKDVHADDHKQGMTMFKFEADIETGMKPKPL
jgi:hypothetical protein